MRDNKLEKPLHDTEAECWVIGSILLKPALIDDLTLQPEDFSCTTNAAIFREMRSLSQQCQPIHSELLKKHFPSDAWQARVGEIVASVPVAAHVHRYAEIVRDFAGRRLLRDAGNFLINESANRDNATEAILDASESMLQNVKLGDNERTPVTMSEATAEACERIDAIAQQGQASGVTTGLSDFDHDQGGLHPGELVILAARPGLGKTSLALQIADHVSEKGKLVYFASLEMSAVELSIRLACSKSGVSNRLVRTGRLTPQDNDRLAESMAKQAKNNLVIHDQASLTVNEIRRQVRRLKRQGLALAVIDYLQLLTPSDRKIVREQQVATMTKALKELAREFSIPILCLAQLNRQVDGNKQPQLSHLRESGAIEQDADMVLFLAPHKPTPEAQNNASLIVAKNRNGEVGCLPLDWHPNETRFVCPGPVAIEWEA